MRPPRLNAPTDSRRSRSASFLASLAVHAALIGALVWLNVDSTPPARDDLDRSSAAQGVVNGSGVLRLTPPRGPSLSTAEAAPYLGRYAMGSPGSLTVELRVTLEQHFDGHWALQVSEDGVAPYALVRMGPDSFASRHNREHAVVFERRDGTITAVEVSWLGSVRRGARIPVLVQH